MNDTNTNELSASYKVLEKIEGATFAHEVGDVVVLPISVGNKLVEEGKLGVVSDADVAQVENKTDEEIEAEAIAKKNAEDEAAHQASLNSGANPSDVEEKALYKVTGEIVIKDAQGQVQGVYQPTVVSFPISVGDQYVEAGLAERV